MEGVGIISRIPMNNPKVSLLPRLVGNPSDGHQRILLSATVHQSPSIQIDVHTSHFSLFPPAQIKASHAISSSLSPSSSSIFEVFGGDLNAEPKEEAIRYLEKNGGWEDLMKKINLTKNTFPTDKPHKRIDYFFGRKNSTKSMRKVKVSNGGYLGELDEKIKESSNIPLNLHFTSDHIGIWVELEIDSKNNNPQDDKIEL